jgi:OTU-like cysteine protease/PUB domain
MSISTFLSVRRFCSLPLVDSSCYLANCMLQCSVPLKILPNITLDFTVFDSRRHSAALEDTLASSYLDGTLQRFLARGIRLVPHLTDTDGSCLTHAISRALVGSEIFYDALRASLEQELVQNRQWYKDNVPEYGIYDDETFQIIFDETIRASKPTRGRRVGREYYLGDIHILALANVLRRPILVLSNEEHMHSDRHQFPRGLFLPLRFTRAEIMARHGRMPGPLTIGWQSKSCSHFVSVCRPNVSVGDQMDRISQPPWDQAAELLRPLLNVRKLADAMMGLIDSNHPSCRDRALRRILQYLDGVKRFLAEPETHAARSRIKLDNAIFKYEVLQAKYALDLLKVVGFIEEADEHGDRFLVFPATSGLVSFTIIESVERIGQLFLPSGPLVGIPFPAGLQEIRGEAELTELFGSSPFIYQVPWDQATREYGSGPLDAGECW